ncbi:MAG: hypothetical protein U0636_07350 [Phycisphaerales bacterium]
MQRRTLLPLVVSLLGGAIITTGIAWGVAAFPEKGTVADAAGGILDPSFPDNGWFVWMVEGRASTRLVAQAKNYPLEAAALPWWSGLPELCRAKSAVSARLLEPQDTWEVVEDAAGWPFRALRMNSEGVAGPSISHAALSCFGVPAGLTQGRAGRTGGDPRTTLQRLPQEIIWPGFALDTGLWGAILWCVVWGPSTARRWHRNRTGRCLACGYLLQAPRGASCPECGAAL